MSEERSAETFRARVEHGRLDDGLQGMSVEGDEVPISSRAMQATPYDPGMCGVKTVDGAMVEPPSEAGQAA